MYLLRSDILDGADILPVTTLKELQDINWVKIYISLYSHSP